MKIVHEIRSRAELVIAGVIAAATTSISAADSQVFVEIEKPKWTISKHLVGQHIVKKKGIIT